MFRVLLCPLIAMAMMAGTRAGRAQELAAPFPPRPQVVQSVPMPSRDPIREAEIRQRVMLGEIHRHDLEVQARQRDEQRRFAERFNELVEAMTDFGKRYNEGKGSVWPMREAERLRKAMRQVEQAEKSLRGDPAAAHGDRQTPATATSLR